MNRQNRTILTLTAVAAMWLIAHPSGAAQNQNRADATLKAAMDKEIVEGDLKGAIELYSKLAESRDRATAAQALVRMGQCYEKLGSSEARKAYERAVREFGDQKDVVATAKARLAALGGKGSGAGRRLIDKDGRVIGASPDGRSLLAWSADGGVDLRDMRTGQVRSVVKGHWVRGAAFSPDGRQIAFVRDGWDGNELRLAGVDGSAERLLWKPDKGWADDPQWFPDGRRIMVTVYKDDEVLMAISVTDGTATTLWEGKDSYGGQLSPDGTRVAFLRRVSQDPIVDELRLLTLADRSEDILLRWQSLIGYPLWTPDGGGVVFPSDRRSPGTEVDLWLLRVSGGRPLGAPELIRKDLGEVMGIGQVIGSVAVYAAGPITRDGALYFRKGRTADGMRQLMTTRFDPEMGKAVGEPSFFSRMGGEQRSPSFSRDGRWLAYTTVQNPARVFKLVVHSFESGEERVVPMNPTTVDLNWAVMFPDGQSVLVAARHPQFGFGMYRVDVTSGAWTSLKKPGEKGEVRGWPNGISPDGKTIYFGRGEPTTPLSDQTHVIARDIETGREREVAQQVIPGVFSLSFDGTKLAVGIKDGTDVVLKVVPTAGGPSREIFRDSRFGVLGLPAWMPDGQSVILNPSRTAHQATSFLIVPVGGGAVRDIGIAPSPDGQFPQGFGTPLVHPNGRQLVYSAHMRQASSYKVHYETWVLENFLPKAAK